MKYSLRVKQETYQKAQNMTVEELLYKVVCPNIFEGSELPNQNVACVFMHPMEKDKAIAKVKEINTDSEYKRLIVTDVEAGSGDGIIGATLFPSMLAAAKTKDRELCYKMGKIAAIEALNASYHWTFSPVVDMLINPNNPTTSIRSAGETKDDVLLYAGSYMKGLQDHGLIATIKHFPGDGYDSYDQHLTTTTNAFSKTKWDETYGKIYRTFINEGVKVVMVGQLSLPAYDEIDDLYGIYPPSTISKNIMDKLLKQELEFEGLIVSDA